MVIDSPSYTSAVCGEVARVGWRARAVKCEMLLHNVQSTIHIAGVGFHCKDLYGEFHCEGFRGGFHGGGKFVRKIERHVNASERSSAEV